MRTFFYAAKQAFKPKGSHLIKLLSLTLGLIIGGTLAARVAFEQSWDSMYADVERIYIGGFL